MTIEDLKFNPAKHLVNGKLRPPDKCEMALMAAHASEYNWKSMKGHRSFIIFYFRWWCGWQLLRSRPMPTTEGNSSLWIEFGYYMDENMPEGVSKD